MSYILNALKKAERDRKREEAEDLDDFVGAGWDPYQEPVKSTASYTVAAIIVLVAALLFYGFYNLTNKSVVSDVEIASENLIEMPVNSQEEPLETQPVKQKLEEEPVEKLQQDEPVSEELRLPEVTIAGHIYIRSGSAKNRIFIGEKTYYVGDAIDNDWVIESINFDSLSIRSGTLSSELPLR
jgi:hypothetical protein